MVVKTSHATFNVITRLAGGLIRAQFNCQERHNKEV